MPSNKKKQTPPTPKQALPAAKQVKAQNPDFQQIHDLVKLINDNNIGELSFEKDGYKLTIKQKGSDVVYAAAPPQINLPVAPATPQKSGANTPATPPPPPPAPTHDSNLITIKSPMIGTFYSKPSPDKPNFVEVGTEIKKGQVLCIVEAMKLFNDIESEVSGKIVKVLVNNASPIEYDQPLFVVDPS